MSGDEPRFLCLTRVPLSEKHQARIAAEAEPKGGVEFSVDERLVPDAGTGFIFDPIFPKWTLT